MQSLSGYSRRPEASLLCEILTCLDAQRDVLIVLNHPLWDQGGIGAARHREALLHLIESAGHRIHALELNGSHYRRSKIVVKLALQPAEDKQSE